MNETQIPDKSNKKLLWFSGIFGVIALIIIAVIASFMFTAPSDSSTGNKTGDTGTSSGALNEKTVPGLDSSSLKQIGTSPSGTLSFVVKKPENNLVVEYRIEDTNKRIIDEGLLGDNRKVSAQVFLVNGDNDFNVKLRTSNETSYSPWTVVETVSLNVTALPEAEGQNTEAEPNAAYFDTEWAKENGGPENLQDAMLKAWNAEPVATDGYCMILNNAAINPGEMVQPIPSIMPVDYKLRYDAYFDNETAHVTFFWCV